MNRKSNNKVDNTKFWLVKSDPDTYSWDNLVNDKTTIWDGVRNYQARNNLRDMKKNDLVLFYHSQIDKAIFGIAKVKKEAFPDPSIDDSQWIAVTIAAVKSLKHMVTLEQIKINPKLKNIGLLRQSRLSVMPLDKDQFEEIIKQSK